MDVKNAIDITNIKTYTFNTVIVGSGAAAFNAANCLYELGVTDIAVVTECINAGTSRNTGSDKQTYYKMSTSGAEGDSPYAMAKTLFDGGAMHGDVALVDASLSTMNFYNLKRLGVPFPTDQYGQHVGYKTDHDPYARASSAGPLTSKYMTECLEAQVMQKNIPVINHHQVISIIHDGGAAVGLLAIDKERINKTDYGFALFNAVNIIYCTGGPAGIYYKSVFPPSQFGGTGIALEAGVHAANLTEWQYGIASTKFRWNLSGTYQQVLPRYVSVRKDMSDERDFLCDYFDTLGAMNDAVFLKGYQWPFDVRKLAENGSSVIDVLVYIETQIKKRRVFLDYQKNPTHPNTNNDALFSSLSPEAYDYLKNSDALMGTPIERLAKMNPLAIDLYKNNGIDLTSEYLEIDVCAQHNNGGLQTDIWWQSSLKHFFPVGEVAGTLGVYRPGGSALNATQTGGVRAAQYIAKKYHKPPMPQEQFMNIAMPFVQERYEQCEKVTVDTFSNITSQRHYFQQLMTEAAAFFREKDRIGGFKEFIKMQLNEFFNYRHVLSLHEITEVFRNYDMFICQLLCLSQMYEYMEQSGQSRGSFIIADDHAALTFKNEALTFNYALDTMLFDRICVSAYRKDTLTVTHHWEPVRPIPQNDLWFENVWRDYREDKIYE